MHLLSILWSLTAICAGVAQISGCGSGAQSASTSSQAVVIIAQPRSQSVPLGQAATFTVTATGTAPLTYLWSKDGAPIAGATGDSYTTPDVAAGDSGAQIAVTVTNSVNSVASSAATLTVGPRSPKAGDLRFQEVGSSSEAEQSLEGATSGFQVSKIENSDPQWCQNCVGSPLSIGVGGACDPVTSTCGWSFFTTPLPPGQTGLNTYYAGGQYANFASDLTSGPIAGWPPVEAPNSVITSLDFHPAYGVYGIVWIQITQQDGAFDMRREIVAPGAVQATVAQDAAQSRVVTAVSFDANGQANLISYGWQGDTTTLYDTSVIPAATQAAIESAVQSLAAQGYILTAFGGDPTNGFLLIGTKVHGDTLARPLQIYDQTTAACYHCGVGYAPVLWYELPQDEWAVIYEK